MGVLVNFACIATKIKRAPMIKMVDPDICSGAQLGSFAPLCSNAILNDSIGAATRVPDFCEYNFLLLVHLFINLSNYFLFIFPYLFVYSAVK